MTTDGVGAPSDELDLRAAVDIADIEATRHEHLVRLDRFRDSQTITLADGPLELTNTSAATTIDGSAAGRDDQWQRDQRRIRGRREGQVSISGLTIARGNAASGGGVYNQGTTQLTDCTVSGNAASGSGGGLFNSGTLTLTNCTITGNSAAARRRIRQLRHGAVVFVHAQRQLRRPGGGIDNWCRHGHTRRHHRGGQQRHRRHRSDIGGNNAMDVTGTYDLVGTGGSGGISNGADHDIVLSSLTALGLAPLGNYGGPTETIALLPGSLAIGAGVKENGIDTDQRGEPLDSPSPDIGAFQSQGFTFTRGNRQQPADHDDRLGFR